MYKESKLVTAGGKEIKNKEKVLQLLEAVWEPSQVAIIHCRGHQRGTDYVSREKPLADQVTKRAAEVPLECQSKPPNFCWLQSYHPPQITPRRKKQWIKDFFKNFKGGGVLVEVV
jgi:hypothetical protein